MIQNEREYEITKRAAAKLERALERADATAARGGVHPESRALWEAQKAALRSQLGDLRAEMLGWLERLRSAPKCPKCGGSGVIETGNNDLPCDCPAGDSALFNTVEADGPVTGAEVRRHFLNDSPEPIRGGRTQIHAASLPGRRTIRKPKARMERVFLRADAQGAFHGRKPEFFLSGPEGVECRVPPAMAESWRAAAKAHAVAQSQMREAHKKGLAREAKLTSARHAREERNGLPIGSTRKGRP